MTIRVFFILAVVLFSAPFLRVARCDSETVVVEGIEEGRDIGIGGEDVQDFGEGSFGPAPGVETVCIFPRNPSKLVPAGEQKELLVGMKNDGESALNVIAIQATLHLPYDHSYIVQNLSTQGFNNATVRPFAQAAFPYLFGVSKFLQPGTFDLVSSTVYEVDQLTYQSTFYNGTIVAFSVLSLFSCFL
ncbi:unnamed protein product [Cuscuta campestris]|uniref:Translocon-associated protein subunit alpha n=1 Tax=Cuscuta campestris TaxID=132261 RepID=A0A484LQ91_9ASTE|nr:unnamed protein product [Cuscuta campestris]